MVAQDLLCWHRERPDQMRASRRPLSDELPTHETTGRAKAGFIQRRLWRPGGFGGAGLK